MHTAMAFLQSYFPQCLQVLHLVLKLTPEIKNLTSETLICHHVILKLHIICWRNVISWFLLLLVEVNVKVLKQILHLSYFLGSYIILVTEFPRCSFLLYLTKLELRGFCVSSFFLLKTHFENENYHQNLVLKSLNSFS